MNNIYKSATVKLTAWYLTLVMAISLIASVIVYYSATHALANGLQNQMERIYEKYPVFSDDPFFVRHSDISNGAHNLLLDLIYFNIVVLFVAGFASYWLAQRTLNPIEASNERQKRFVADASHELRTPLTSLKMGSEVALMDDGLSKADLKEALKSNLEEANKLDGLLNNLLRLSQLESDEIRHKFVSLKLSPVVASAIDHVKKQAAPKQITINDKTDDLSVIGDRDSLVQLLVIFLDNAIKYSANGKAITLSSKRTQAETTITVSDEGMGIEPKALERVFDRFYRADKARTGNHGFGLGLSIAKHIADVHNGSITLSSTVGKGTQAALHLPNDPVKANLKNNLTD